MQSHCLPRGESLLPAVHVGLIVRWKNIVLRHIYKDFGGHAAFLFILHLVYPTDFFFFSFGV
jgi:hypothetical protein